MVRAPCRACPRVPTGRLRRLYRPMAVVVIFTETVPTTVEDVMAMTLDGTRRVTPLVQSRSIERNGIVSPDGRWLAYEANDSGRFEFSCGRSPTSTPVVGKCPPPVARDPCGRGARRSWSTSRRMARSWGWALRAARRGRLAHRCRWSRRGITRTLGDTGRTYDMAADAQRFLMIKEERRSDEPDPSAGIVVVQNWFEELKRLVPVN